VEGDGRACRFCFGVVGCRKSDRKPNIKGRITA
jgi:hypothetical protein